MSIGLVFSSSLALRLPKAVVVEKCKNVRSGANEGDLLIRDGPVMRFSISLCRNDARRRSNYWSRLACCLGAQAGYPNYFVSDNKERPASVSSEAKVSPSR